MMIIILLASVLIVPISSANDEVKTESTVAKWTYMSFFCFDTAIAEGYVKDDSTYAYNTLKAIGSTEDVNSVSLLDTRYPDDATHYFYFKNSTTIVDLGWFESDSNTGDKDILVKFVKETMERFPAERYALIMSSPRGMSWQGVMLDDGTHGPKTQKGFESKFMSMDELSSALREITNNGREKIDVIGFSTCITGSFEVAYQVSPYVKYSVASEQNMQSFTSNVTHAWPLNNSLRALLNNPNMTGEEFAKTIVGYFVPGKDIPSYVYASPFKYLINIPVTTTLAATNLSRISNLSTAIDNLSKILINNIKSYRKIILEARDEARKFGPWYSNFFWGYWHYTPIFKKYFDRLGISVFMDVWLDIHHFAKLLKSKIKDSYPDSEMVKQACSNVMNALNYTILANNVTEGDNASGLHIYFPPNAYKYNQHIWVIHSLSLIWKKPYVCYEDTDFADVSNWNEMLYKVYKIPDSLVPLWLKNKIPIV